MREASEGLSGLVARIEAGELPGVIITRDGAPVARLVPLSGPPVRLGASLGRYAVPDDIDFCNDEVAELFGLA